MFLPLGTDRSLRRPTLVTYALIALNVIVFLWQYVFEPANPEEYRRLADMLYLSRGGFEFHTLVTYQFLHAGWMHLLGNMLFLFVFGPNVEDKLGRIGFALFYLGGGIAAGLAHIAADPSPVIGASGAISAVTGAYLALFPRTKLKVLVMFFFIGIFWIPAWWLIALAIAKDLVFQGFSSNDNVARMAHIGGYAFGLGICLSLLWWKILPRETYDLFSIGRQMKRRRQFRELASKGDSPWTNDAPKSMSKETETRNSALEEAAFDERAKISELLSEPRFDEATSRFKKALDHFPDFTLSRNDLIALGNHLFKSEQYTLASSAYEKLISQFPADVETPRTIIMLAIINTRYLNDPIRAKQLIDMARKRHDDESYKDLIESLERELG